MPIGTDPIHDPDTRVSLARRESREFEAKVRVVGWIVGLGSGLIVAAIAYFNAPLWITLGAATALIILSLASIITMMIDRFYVQNAYTEMTVDNVEAEVKESREHIERIQYDVERIEERTKPRSLDY
jgi:hypothetical protein